MLANGRLRTLKTADIATLIYIGMSHNHIARLYIYFLLNIVDLE
jgi:hypothetical protein